MENKFLLDIYNKKTNSYDDYKFEIQSMDSFIFDDTMTRYSKEVDLKKCASKILGEMIVKPAEARKVEFFKDDFEALEEVFKTLTDFQSDFKKRPGKRKGRRPVNAG